MDLLKEVQSSTLDMFNHTLVGSMSSSYTQHGMQIIIVDPKSRSQLSQVFKLKNCLSPAITDIINPDLVEFPVYIQVVPPLAKFAVYDQWPKELIFFMSKKAFINLCTYLTSTQWLEKDKKLLKDYAIEEMNTPTYQSLNLYWKIVLPVNNSTVTGTSYWSQVIETLNDFYLSFNCICTVNQKNDVSFETQLIYQHTAEQNARFTFSFPLNVMENLAFQLISSFKQPENDKSVDQVTPELQQNNTENDLSTLNFCDFLLNDNVDVNSILNNENHHPINPIDISNNVDVIATSSVFSIPFPTNASAKPIQLKIAKPRKRSNNKDNNDVKKNSKLNKLKKIKD
jgi:hypothetical protein